MGHPSVGTGGVPFFNATVGVKSDGASTPITTGIVVDSGVQLVEAKPQNKFTFQAIGSGAGFSASFYGTIDPAAYWLYQYNNVNNPLTVAQLAGGTLKGGVYDNTTIGTGLGRGSTSLPATSWFLLPAPSEDSSGGQSSNPMLQTGMSYHFTFSGLVAVKCVIDCTNLTGSVQILGFSTC